MEALLLLASPLVVTGLTQVIKKAQAIDLSQNRVLLIRLVVAVLAVLSSVLSSIIGEGSVDETVVHTLLEAIVIYLGAHGVYFFRQSTTPPTVPVDSQ